MKRKYFGLTFLVLIPLFFSISQSSPVSLISSFPSSVRVYEKFEIKFNVNTAAENYFFSYDENPPAGVKPKIGVSVDGIFYHVESGKTYTQPAFWTVEVIRSGSGRNMVFEETNKSYWVLRFSPQKTGTYKVSIRVKDKNQDVTTYIGQFTALTPIRKGFIGVSKSDPRYFEFSNGELYFPIGPAWYDNKSSNPNASFGYFQYIGTGLNYERIWLAGIGAYSTNFARWISSAERMGNEGYMTLFAYDNGTGEKVPTYGELSYPLFYPDGFRFWLTTWGNEMLGPRLKAGQKYRVEIVYKTSNISGPRVSGYPYGFVVKAGTPDIMWRQHTISEFESFMRNSPNQILFPYDNQNHTWRTATYEFTATQDWQNIYLYLDNVSNGQVYIYKFSIKPVLSDGSLGGEVIRNPIADQHTYVDPRGAAFIDWLVEEAEKAGVYLQLVVHDKNDAIQNRLKMDGTWTDIFKGDGYYQPENTKARWLLRQWYRYLAARWGYSPNIFAWELNNEGPPDEDPPGSGTSPHWRTAQAFAQFMHTVDSHPHLASTSFWCCWRPQFWGNNTYFPDINYADVHEYTNNPQVASQNYTYDEVSFIYSLGVNTAKDNVGKPVLIGEHGISGSNWMPVSELQQPNSGVYYHNMLWAQLNSAQIFAPDYWYSDHLRYINREEISKPFAKFVSNLDVNKGGYVNLQASVSNSKLRVLGQKNLYLNKAYGWIQNTDYTWYNAYRNYYTYQSGQVRIKLNPNYDYLIEWWDTYTGVTSTQTQRSDYQGYVTLNVNNLKTDVAFKIYPLSGSTPSYPPLSVSCSASPNPANINQTVTFTSSVSGGTGSYTYSWSGACSGSSSTCSTSFSSAGTYTANLTVTSGSETKSTSCSVNVQAPQPAPLPTVDLKVNNSDGPISVTVPTSITLSWTSQNASSCTASGSWSGSKSTSGSQSISLSSAGTYTYTLTCTNSSGSASDSVTVNAQSASIPINTTTTVTKVYTISNTNRDAESIGTRIYTLPSSAPWGQMYLGYDRYTSGKVYDGGWIFETDIPKGAKIVSSTLTLTANSDNYGPIKLTGYWYGYATSNPPDFVNGYSGKRISTIYPRTSNYVYQSFYVVSQGRKIISSNLAKIVQEIVNRPDFKGKIGLTFRTTNSSDVWQSWIDYSDDPANSAILTVVYEATSTPSYPPLSVSCSASPNPANINQTVTFTSSVSGGTGSYTYSWSGACSGSSSTCSTSFSSAGTYTANLTVTSGSETKSTSCSVNVQAPQPAPLPTVDLKVNNSDGPISVTVPTSITLSWTSQNASSCTASGSWSGSKSTSGSQSISLSSAGTYTYTLTCTNSSGSASDSVTVNAQSAPTPTTTTFEEWTQFAHDPMRTSYTPQFVSPPWKWKWSWNGPDANGNPVPGKFRLPRNSQPITGGGRVYIAAGSRGVYALNNSNGSVIWNVNPGGARIDSTPAYDPQADALFVLSSNGTLYKLNASNGSILASYSSGQTIPKGETNFQDPNQTLPLPPLLYGNRVYFVAGTKMFALDKNNLSVVWSYDSGGSPFVTPVAYSPSYNRLVAVTRDLYVNAVDANSGSLVWRTKPTIRNYGDPGENNQTLAQAEYGWPVIAERTGLVLIKYRLDWNALFNPFSPWPTDNATIRAALEQNPQYQALFALKLSDGSKAFTANIGHGGWGDGGYLPMGNIPAVKSFPDGSEVAYLVIRGHQAMYGTWDSLYGELVLDNSNSNFQPGYVRWIQYGNYGWYNPPLSNIMVPPTDEQPYVIIAGNYLFGGHWILGQALEIKDRSSNLGTYTNPIKSVPLPHIVESTNLVPYNSSHYSDSMIAATAGGTEWRAVPYGFYIYNDSVGKIYDQYWSGYATWIVSNNTIYFLSTDGALVALEQGNPTQLTETRKIVINENLIKNISSLASRLLAQISSPKPIEIQPEDISKNFTELLNKEVLLRGKIIKVVANHHGTFIKLHQTPYSPTIIIKPDVYSEFSKPPFEIFKPGMNIKVKGILTYYRGDPAIYITNPSQILSE